MSATRVFVYITKDVGSSISLYMTIKMQESLVFNLQFTIPYCTTAVCEIRIKTQVASGGPLSSNSVANGNFWSPQLIFIFYFWLTQTQWHKVIQNCTDIYTVYKQTHRHTFNGLSHFQNQNCLLANHSTLGVAAEQGNHEMGGQLQQGKTQCWKGVSSAQPRFVSWSVWRVPSECCVA